MNPYIKLFKSMLDSSVWFTPVHVRIVWFTMLGMSNEDGVVEAGIPALARRACVTREECVNAVHVLSSPDKYAEEGQWIRGTDRGWLILPHDRLSAMFREDMHRFRDAERQRECRERKRLPVLERDGFRCRYCGSSDDLVIDHIVPRCQGGGDEPSNLATACAPCNGRKGGRTPQQAGMELLCS